ncbi:MAG: GlsB/YeaQ/YmgE family stress response membrane protein [Acidimicrobiia bacterium]|nr:GlsB/YeaQ/YmgE family stress response membrane protein [Acidimicrobiia bacterium]
MLVSLIGTVITGGIIGALGRLLLPGGQDIGLVKTILLGIVSAVIVGLVTSGIGTFASILLGSVVAAGLLWLAIRQGWLTPSPS